MSSGSLRRVPQTSHVRAWVNRMRMKGRDLLSICLALENVADTQGEEWMIRNLGSPTLDFAVRAEDMERWLSFWERPEEAWADGADQVFCGRNTSRQTCCVSLRRVRKRIAKLAKMPPRDRRKQLNELIVELPGQWTTTSDRALKSDQSSVLEDLMSIAVYGEPPSPEIDARIDADPLPAMFIARVGIPTFLRFQQSPTELLDRGLSGDRQALARLVTLDSNVRHHPGIAEEINNLVLSSARKSWLLEQERAARVIAKRKPRQYAKYLNIGATVDQSQTLVYRLFVDCEALEIPDVVALLDAVARDRNPRVLRDEDLHDDPGALRKQVQRVREKLRYLQWDIQKCFECPA